MPSYQGWWIWTNRDTTTNENTTKRSLDEDGESILKDSSDISSLSFPSSAPKWTEHRLIRESESKKIFQHVSKDLQLNLIVGVEKQKIQDEKWQGEEEKEEISLLEIGRPIWRPTGCVCVCLQTSAAVCNRCSLQTNHCPLYCFYSNGHD